MTSAPDAGAAEHYDHLTAILQEIGSVAVALSGGVDSMTLAHVAHSALGRQAEMFHAMSPAVPREAGERVRRHAIGAGWRLNVVDAGETTDERYVANPVNRCFFCKTNLYGFIAGATTRTIVSGTNTDDLGDFRPGLEAATDHAVRHPYVEANLDKSAVRALARHLSLDDIAELPAAPCLASRIETGLRVTPKRLEIVDVVERHLRERATSATIRCRVRSRGVVIEVDAASLETIKTDHAESVVALLEAHGAHSNVQFEPYQQGGAFVHENAP